jgi:DNA repair protein RadC
MTSDDTSNNYKEAPHKGVGHRKRLRDRFLQSGLDGFLDYEIVELLLTLGTPRRDCKQIAKEAIKEFKGLQGVLNASAQELQKLKGIGPSNAFGLKLFQAVSERYTKDNISEKLSLSSADVVASYLQKLIGMETKEHFVILYLDSRHKLIVDDVSIGTLNASLVHPREVFKKAILTNAAQCIVAHNHPSGDPEPSPQDIALTRQLVDASKIIGIDLIDHVIVTSNKFRSLKELKLL